MERKRGFWQKKEPYSERVRRFLGMREKSPEHKNPYALIEKKLRRNPHLVNRGITEEGQRVVVGAFEFDEGQSIVVTNYPDLGHMTAIDAPYLIGMRLRQMETIFLYPDGTGNKTVVQRPGTDEESLPDVADLTPLELAALYDKFSGGRVVRFRIAM